MAQLRTEVTQVWDAYQASRYGYVVARLPQALAAGQAATQSHEGEDQEQSFALLALTYQATAVLLTKLGEADLAWIAAERGFTAAQRCGDVVVIGSLFRSVTHTLLSTGRFREAKQLTTDAAAYMQPGLAEATPEYLSVYGTLFLAGSVAAARDEDRTAVRSFLSEADETARRLGHDANHLWTASAAVTAVLLALDEGRTPERPGRRAAGMSSPTTCMTDPSHLMLDSLDIRTGTARYPGVGRLGYWPWSGRVIRVTSLLVAMTSVRPEGEKPTARSSE